MRHATYTQHGNQIFFFSELPKVVFSFGCYKVAKSFGRPRDRAGIGHSDLYVFMLPSLLTQPPTARVSHSLHTNGMNVFLSATEVE